MIIFRYKNSNLDQKDGQRNMWVIIWQTWTTPKLPSGGIFYVASVFYQGMQIIAQSRYGCSYLWLKPTRRLFWVARGCCFGKNSKIKETSMNNGRKKSFLVQIKGVSKSEMASRPIKQASITLHWYLSSMGNTFYLWGLSTLSTGAFRSRMTALFSPAQEDLGWPE